MFGIASMEMIAGAGLLLVVIELIIFRKRRDQQRAQIRIERVEQALRRGKRAQGDEAEFQGDTSSSSQ